MPDINGFGAADGCVVNCPYMDADGDPVKKV